MGVFVKTISDLVALFLQALRLSVILPAVVFVGLNVTLVVPRLRDTILYQNLGLSDEQEPVTVVVFLCILLVGYALAVANIPIIRFFEGYPWLTFGLGARLRLSHARRIAYLQEQIEELDNQIRACQEEIKDEREREVQAREEQNELKAGRARRTVKVVNDEMNRYQMRKNLYIAELSWTYPHHQPWRLLPTRLGNVIAAAEEYSSHLYGLDAVTFWPFLTPILTQKGYAPFVEREKATFDFLLNMVVITLIFGAELIYLDVLLYRSDFWTFIWTTFFKLFITLILAFSFYFLSIQGALSWGYTIRTACVLYRDQLRQQLGLSKPEGFYQEQIMWKQATRFFLDHDITPGNYIFDYSRRATDISLEISVTEDSTSSSNE
ncbi:MAG: hypothetical protein KJ077_28895 [Anaerolineae bacterium]|nr:hypothetical protein [Anaerolineae bacterium]